MRQVPKYAVIGNGRMATHICHYFDCLAIKYHHWYRSQCSPSALDAILLDATHVLVLIADVAIEPFVKEFILPKHQHLLAIHFSGSLISSIAYSAHPLQTFIQTSSFTINDYQKIPFILEKGAPSFQQLLPGLNNPYYYIPKESKGYYHAMCVLANNITTLLWQKFYREMQTRFDIKPHDLEPFLYHTFQNIYRNPSTALSGPFVRNDLNTLIHDLAALSGDPYQIILKAFMEQFYLMDQTL